MKKLILRLAAGTALAAAVVVVSGAGASASSGYDNGHYGQSKYQKSDHYNRSDSYKKADYSYKKNNYKKTDHNDYRYQQPKQKVVYKAVYQKPAHHSNCSCGNYNQHNNYNNYGFWYNGKWYEYKNIGYWDKYGRWVSYHHNWNDYDWQEWRKTCH